MIPAPNVVLLGGSVLMEGVASYLVNESTIQVIQHEDMTHFDSAELCALRPDIIIFERESLPAGGLIHLMGCCPEVPWVALELNCSQVSVMNNRKYATQTMKDLLSIIQEVIPSAEGIKGGKWTEPLKKVLQAKT
jgi:hypothetical protein